MNALVTGIAGFAGSHLAEHLLSAGDTVLGVVRARNANERTPGDVQLIAWDLSAPASDAVVAVVRAFGPQVVYHLAAVSKAGDCEQDPAAAQRVNVLGTENLLKLVVTLPHPPRVIFVSTSNVYQVDAARGDRPPVQETDPTQFDSHYAATKLRGESLLQQYLQTPGRDALIVRAFQHAGPRQAPKFVLAQWCAQFASPNATPVLVQRDQAWIDLSDVRDVVRAYRLLALHGRSGEIYNVGRGTAIRTGDVFDQLRTLADPTRPFEVHDSQPHYGPIADIRKLAAATGWQAEIPLERTVRETWAAARGLHA